MVRSTPSFLAMEYAPSCRIRDAWSGEALSAESVITHYDTFSPGAAKCRGLSEGRRRHKLHILRPAASGRTKSLRCASSSQKVHGLFGSQRPLRCSRRPIENSLLFSMVSPCIRSFPALHILGYAAATIAAAYMSFTPERCVRTYAANRLKTHLYAALPAPRFRRSLSRAGLPHLLCCCSIRDYIFPKLKPAHR